MDSDIRKKLEDKLRRLLEADDEEAQDELHAQISRLSPDPDWSDYVFQSNEFYDNDGNLNYEEVINRISEYQPIQL